MINLETGVTTAPIIEVPPEEVVAQLPQFIEPAEPSLEAQMVEALHVLRTRRQAARIIGRGAVALATTSASAGLLTMLNARRALAARKCNPDHQIQSGDTYSGILATEGYDETLGALEDANGYPARALPVGKTVHGICPGMEPQATATARAQAQTAAQAQANETGSTVFFWASVATVLASPFVFRFARWRREIRSRQNSK